VEEEDFGVDRLLDVNMGVDELHANIQTQIELHGVCRTSWLNRMLAKSNTLEEFNKSLDIYHKFQSQGLETTAETATLLLKVPLHVGRILSCVLGRMSSWSA
jgi:hypothetical protein